MAVLHNSIYQISVANNNYVDVLLQYNKKCRICSINGISLQEYVAMSELSQIVTDANHIKNGVVTIQVRSGDYQSLLGIFPKIKTSIQVPLTESGRENCDKITDYIQDIIHHKGTNLGICPPSLAALTNVNEAESLFDHLNTSLNISGAVHLPQSKKIIFEIDEVAFVLDYMDPNEPYVEELHVDIHFDIDDGFLNHDATNRSNHTLVTELNALFFEPWKNTNYSGEMIADHQANLYSHDLYELRKAARMMRLAQMSFGSPFYQKKSSLERVETDLAMEIVLLQRGKVPVERAMEEVSAIMSASLSSVLTQLRPPLPPSHLSPSASLNDASRSFLEEFRHQHQAQLTRDRRTFFGFFSCFRRTQVDVSWQLTDIVHHGLAHDNRTRKVLLQMDYLVKNAQGHIQINEEKIKYEVSDHSYHVITPQDISLDI